MWLLYLAASIVILAFVIQLIRIGVRVHQQYKHDKWLRKHPGMKEAIDKVLYGKEDENA